ncbi:hypothetical protein O3P69_004784 [Scylla paramamosain]|uniref:Receptor ligand binding region domain-containing protein n=1 Tax=Scylla paramamosain TaxID=85552 RepID=A0AAW0UBX5_SCYPA
MHGTSSSSFTLPTSTSSSFTLTTSVNTRGVLPRLLQQCQPCAMRTVFTVGVWAWAWVCAGSLTLPLPRPPGNMGGDHFWRAHSGTVTLCWARCAGLNGRLLGTPSPPRTRPRRVRSRGEGDSVAEVIQGTQNTLREVMKSDGGTSSVTLLLLTSSSSSTSSVRQITAEWRGGVGVFQLDLERGYNFTHLLSRVRQLRRRSWRVVVVVVAGEDIPFLGAFCESSLSSRLLVRGTRLVVLTSLSAPRLHALLHAHWTLSMMDALLINLEEGNRCGVYLYLPYSPGGGGQVVQVATWAPSHGLTSLTPLPFFPDKYSNFHGGLFNITSLNFMPFWGQRTLSTTTTTAANITTTFTGFNSVLVAAMAAKLNFSVHLLPSDSWDDVRY